jgi:hypothetical protein
VAFVILALHVVVLSVGFGQRHFGYLVAATLSAAFVWSVVLFLNERKRRAGIIAGVIVGLVVQQLVYHHWKAELPGFWLPLAQFGAVQFLVAYGLGRTAS